MKKFPAATYSIAGARGPRAIHTNLIQTKVIRAYDPGAPGKAASVLRAGGVIVYPTETLYGIGALASDESAVEMVFEIKGRPHGIPIPVLGKDLRMLEEVVEFNDTGRLLAENFWPGALTLVLKDRGKLIKLISAATGTTAVRISANPFVTRLFNELDGPLTSTSANPSGGGNLLEFDHIYSAFNGSVELIIDSGSIPPSKGSTVVDVTITPPRVLREGDLSVSELKEFF